MMNDLMYKLKEIINLESVITHLKSSYVLKLHTMIPISDAHTTQAPSNCSLGRNDWPLGIELGYVNVFIQFVFTSGHTHHTCQKKPNKQTNKIGNFIRQVMNLQELCIQTTLHDSGWLPADRISAIFN